MFANTARRYLKMITTFPAESNQRRTQGGVDTDPHKPWRANESVRSAFHYRIQIGELQDALKQR